MQRAIDYDVFLMQRDMAEQGLNDAELASLAGVNRSTVCRFFSGRSRTAPTAKKLARAMRKSLRRYVVTFATEAHR